jgi:intracellular sulfur oxidation DsrE/DsrF family protein
MLIKIFKSLVPVLAIVGIVFALSPSVAQAHEKLVIQVNSNDKTIMTYALNVAANVTKYYQDLGEETPDIEIVAFGPGLHMLRADTSPVKQRMEGFLAGSFPNVTFAACGNTMQKMTKKEGKVPELLTGVTNVPAGVIRIMELQDLGYNYIKS